MNIATKDPNATTKAPTPVDINAILNRLADLVAVLNALAPDLTLENKPPVSVSSVLVNPVDFSNSRLYSF